MNFEILGTGGFAVELAGLVESSGGDVHGFYGPQIGRVSERKYLGTDADVLQKVGVIVLVAVGDPIRRRCLVDFLWGRGIELGIFVHPSAHIDETVVVGSGSIVYPGVIVHRGCVVGPSTLLNSNVSLGHDTTIAGLSNLNPGVSVGGNCSLGSGVTLGIGSSVRDGISINDDVTVGAGSTVVTDLSEKGVYVGCPARRLEDRCDRG